MTAHRSHLQGSLGVLDDRLCMGSDLLCRLGQPDSVFLFQCLVKSVKIKKQHQ